MKNKFIKYLHVCFFATTASVTTFITIILIFDGYEKYAILNEIKSSEALVYLGVAAIAFLFTAYAVVYIFDILKMSHESEMSEIAHLG